jgi:hypothetical protein
VRGTRGSHSLRLSSRIEVLAHEIESFADYASMNELEWARIQRQRKLMAAIMAHPSYTAPTDGLTTREGRSC